MPPCYGLRTLFGAGGPIWLSCPCHDPFRISGVCAENEKNWFFFPYPCLLIFTDFRVAPMVAMPMVSTALLMACLRWFHFYQYYFKPSFFSLLSLEEDWPCCSVPSKAIDIQDNVLINNMINLASHMELDRPVQDRKFNVRPAISCLLTHPCVHASILVDQFGGRSLETSLVNPGVDPASEMVIQQMRCHQDCV